MDNPYKILGVTPESSDEEISTAYRKLVKQYHPDKYVGNPLSELAAEKIKEINAAYDAINNERKSKTSGSTNYNHQSYNSGGFDLYIDGEFGSRFVKEFLMSYDFKEKYEQVLHLENAEMRSLTINFPIYSIVESLEIGVVQAQKFVRPDLTVIQPLLFFTARLLFTVVRQPARDLHIPP